jgi:nucleotide-binding universal stress UspA family protein
MLSIRTILCPVDMSPASRMVLSWAGLFAQVFDASVTILHADYFEPPRYFVQSQLETLALQAETNRAVLHEELSQMTRETCPPGVLRDVVVAKGHPIPVILQHAAAQPPDLIVLGSHGRSGVSRLLLGSVAENVVREATCLTLIVKGPESGTPSIKRVLCPVNFTDLARQCLEVSAAVTVAFKAELDVAHAVESGHREPEEVAQHLCRWVPDETRERCKQVEIVREGGAAEQIVGLARERAVDLIVIGAQHSPLLEFTTIGATTERVIRHGPCSVLVVPR